MLSRPKIYVGSGCKLYMTLVKEHFNITIMEIDFGFDVGYCSKGVCMYQAPFLSNAVQSHLLTRLLPKYEIFLQTLLLPCLYVRRNVPVSRTVYLFIVSLNNTVTNQIKNSIYFTYIKIQTNNVKTKHVLW